MGEKKVINHRVFTEARPGGDLGRARRNLVPLQAFTMMINLLHLWNATRGYFEGGVTAMHRVVSLASVSSGNNLPLAHLINLSGYTGAM